jgi:hypothetical protein
MPVQLGGSLSKLAGLPPRREINATSKSLVGDMSILAPIRTDTTLDHGLKAEKVGMTHGRVTSRSCERRSSAENDFAEALLL